ncbi:MAG: phosphoglucosamine mutase [Elusimicrobiota bacterium]|jgi:phosphoglucosamine mutase|nr:phosphoglucosamine mutase [Elusimicrobiota bacterium]
MAYGAKVNMALFGTDGIRGNSTKYPFDNGTLAIIGKAIAKVLCSKKDKLLIISDTRESGARIQKELARGIASEGVEAISGAAMPTPSASFILESKKFVAAIVISASHNPYIDNGIKIFASNGLKLKDGIEAKIEKEIRAFEKAAVKIPPLKKPIKKDLSLLKNYENFIISAYRHYGFNRNDGRKAANGKNEFLKNKTIVIDCANGASFKCAPEVLRKLGAKIIALNIKPNGKNINKNCGALYPQNLAKAVKKHKAFIGFAFDGDADRLICIDEKGGVKDGDFFLASMSKFLKKQGKLKNNVLVTTVMANIGLIIAMKNEKIKVITSKVGDRYVIEDMQKHKSSLGGEQSGHFIFRDILKTGDGLLSAAMLLSALSIENKKPSEFFSIIDKFPQILINKEVKEKVPFEKLQKSSQIIEKYKNDLKDKGRILVRYSGTENLLRVMAEGKDEKQIEQIAKTIINSIIGEINAQIRS